MRVDIKMGDDTIARCDGEQQYVAKHITKNINAILKGVPADIQGEILICINSQEGE